MLKRSFLVLGGILAAALLAGAEPAASADIHALTQKAEAGDPQAQTELGLAYRDSDPSRAAEWFHKAAEQGNPVAQNSLGVLYHSGQGVPKDFDQAFSWYKKSAAQKYGPGVFNVAISYYNGEGVPEDPVTAYAWMLLADELGDKAGHEAAQRTAVELSGHGVDGELKLAGILDAGKELPRDEGGAAKWYRLAGDHGNSEAQVRYGLMLAEGRGVIKNPEEAFQWFRRAAEQKHGPAMFTVGYAYQSGTLGQSVDIKKAMEWYEGAAAAGHPGAMVNLGIMQTDGTAGPPDYKKAYFWFYMADAFNMGAAKAGIATATAHLSQKQITEVQQSVAAWWRKNGRALLVRRMVQQTAEPDPARASNNQPPSPEAKGAGDLPTGVYRVGGEVQAPKLVYGPDPMYDDLSRRKRIAGMVVVKFVVGKDGSTSDVQVVQSLTPELDAQALEAVKQWKFSPATKNGDPVAVLVTAQCNFRIVK